jgi:hypothetical protein
MRKRNNRRRKARLACMLVVQYRSLGRIASAWRPAAVLDLNEVGCRLRITEQLAAGAALMLRFDALLHDGANSATLEAAASVMWCRRQGLSCFELGLALAGAPVELSEILGVLDSA